MEPTIVGIYLAAGKSRRMGSAKLELQFESASGSAAASMMSGKKLGAIALERLRETPVRPILVVTKEGDSLNWLEAGYVPWDRVCGQSDGVVPTKENAVIQLTCPEAERGMAYSIRCGMTAALRYKPEAVVIVLADQPLISGDMIERLVSAYRNASVRPSFVASGDCGKAKPPVLFGRDMFEALMGLEGDQGARRLLTSSDFSGIVLEEEESRFLDVDTPEDWRRLQELLKQC